MSNDDGVYRCVCGHDFWVHRGPGDPSISGGGGICMKCMCNGFRPADETEED